MSSLLRTEDFITGREEFVLGKNEGKKKLILGRGLLVAGCQRRRPESERNVSLAPS
jgi:hypothetical protein